LFEIVTDAGAEDLRDDEDNFEIITAPTDFDGVLEAVKGAGLSRRLLKLRWWPRSIKKLEGAEARQMLKLMEALEDHDDVQKVSANFDISDADMAAAQ
jgi:transcriptional/translational regulatory protein YebC/TACO1